MSDRFSEGQDVVLRAGMLRRADGSIIMRHQPLTLTEEEANRSDADIIFTEAEEELLIPEDTPGGGEEDGDPDAHGDQAVDFSNPQYENLKQLLERANIKRAKEILSNESWDVDGLRVARQAEEDGKDRDRIIEFIDGRIEDVEEGPDTEPVEE